MIEDEMNKLYSSKSGQWDKAIAFSAKDAKSTSVLCYKIHERGKAKDLQGGETLQSHSLKNSLAKYF